MFLTKLPVSTAGFQPPPNVNLDDCSAASLLELPLVTGGVVRVALWFSVCMELNLAEIGAEYFRPVVHKLIHRVSPTHIVFNFGIHTLKAYPQGWAAFDFFR